MAEQDGDAGQRPPDSVPKGGSDEVVVFFVQIVSIANGMVNPVREHSSVLMKTQLEPLQKSRRRLQGLPCYPEIMGRSPILQLKIILAVEPLTPSEGPRIGENIFGYTIVDIFSSSCRGHHKNPPSEPYVLEVNRDVSFYNFRTKQVHEFTARLLDIHDKMMLINNKEDIRLILHRLDYMLDSEINSLLQIENSRSYILPPTLQLSVVPSDFSFQVVGNAVMLGEIINYVQSLQRQVEFMSMKLATVNPQVDLNSLPNVLPKDVRTHKHDRSLHVTTFGFRYGSRGPSSHFVPVCDHVHQSCGPPHFSLETSGASLSYLSQPHHGSPLGCMDNQSCMHPLDTTFCLAINLQYHFLNGVSDASSQTSMESKEEHYPSMTN
ncbi:Glutathione synthetase chloroplastic [Zea mays]|uniref:Glutathione synthetase chloroplastic n=1 Tax=Zea mays TaxID=4577 RepID=A0A1D6MNE4_MAIZE|nr:Glutathione synthetase chloroplastic [Zea mays]